MLARCGGRFALWFGVDGLFFLFLFFVIIFAVLFFRFWSWRRWRCRLGLHDFFIALKMRVEHNTCAFSCIGDGIEIDFAQASCRRALQERDEIRARWLTHWRVLSVIWPTIL